MNNYYGLLQDGSIHEFGKYEEVEDCIEDNEYLEVVWYFDQNSALCFARDILTMLSYRDIHLED
jgi:hypothetical protein